jgi:organic radical activating enzyme
MLYIHQTFQQTIQGEGYFTGVACDFIRLYGCPVGCFFCDTGYEKPNGDYYNKKIPRVKKDIPELLSELKSNLVVISGGEPFIQKGLPELCSAILKTKRAVSIETSGSYWLDVPKEVFVTLSPKQHISPDYPVEENFWQRANEVKIVISKGDEFDFYKDKLKNFKGHKYFQPEFNEHQESVKKCLNLLKDNQDWKLSLQVHKIIGVL